MNRGEIRDLVREYLNEPIAVFWTDAQLNIHINTGAKKVHSLIKNTSRYHFTTRVTFSTVAGTESYNLPTDCKDLKLVTFMDAESREIPLSRAPWPDPTAFTPSGMLDPESGVAEYGPSYYWVIGPVLRLLPRPASVHTIKLYYEARITNMSANEDVPTSDADYHDMIAKWAAIEAGPKDNRDMRPIQALYDIREKDMLQDVLHRVPAPAQEVESYL